VQKETSDEKEKATCRFTVAKEIARKEASGKNKERFRVRQGYLRDTYFDGRLETS
jgi:hypothetical protein